MTEQMREAPYLVSIGRRVQLGSMLVATRVSTLFIGVLFTLLSTRTLGPDGRGSLVALLQCTYVINALISGGQERVLLQSSRSESREAVLRKVFSAGVHTSAGITLLGLALALALYLIGQLDTALWVLLLLAMLVSAAFGLFADVYAIIQGQAGWLFRLRLLLAALSLGLAALLATSDDDNWRLWVLAFAVPQSAAALVSFRRMRQSGPAGFPRRPFIRESLLASGIPLGQMLILRSDRLILAIMFGSQALGLYATAAVPAELMVMACIVFNDTFLPQWSERLFARSPRVVVLQSSLFALCLGVVPAALYVLFGDWAIPLIFGDPFRSATHLVVPLSIAAGLYSFIVSCSTVLTAFGQLRVASVVLAVAGLISVPVYVLAIGEWGSLGAAWASVAVYASTLLAAGLLVAGEVRRL